MSSKEANNNGSSPMSLNEHRVNSILTEGDPSGYAVIVVSTIILSLAVTCNGLVLYVFVKNNHLRTPSGMLILFMATTDLSTGVISLPLSIVRQCFEVMGSTPPFVVDYLYMKFGAALFIITLVLLALLSVDRYLHACYGRRVQTWNLGKKYRILYAVTLVVSIGWIAFVPSISLNKTASKAVGLFIGISVITCIAFSHAKVYLLLRASCKVIPGRSLKMSADFRGKWQRRSTNTLVIINIAFLACFTPRLVRIVLNLLHRHGEYPELERWSATMIYLNSVINPIIYIQRSRKIQLVVKRFLGRE